MRGRKPRPTHLKVIDGNPGHRSLNKGEPKPEIKIPQIPDHLTADARIEWERVTRELAILELVSEADRGALAAYCQAYGRWVAAERAIARIAESDPGTEGLLIKGSMGQPTYNPLVKMADKQMALMLRAAAEFGMTPSARSRISTPEAQGANPMGLLLNLPPKRA